ncbi:hypothetical protein [Rheinheimera fenheensis]|uniref:hypothetical protein n=1 Tax=Rheinheimera fenheensis TaxID=3152295 RepID=UPI00325D6596
MGFFSKKTDKNSVKGPLDECLPAIEEVAELLSYARQHKIEVADRHIKVLLDYVQGILDDSPPPPDNSDEPTGQPQSPSGTSENTAPDQTATVASKPPAGTYNF